MLLSFLQLISVVVVVNANTPSAVSSLYSVRTCLANFIGDTSCTPVPVSNPIRYQTQPVRNPDQCEDTVGQLGSISYVDLTLPNSGNKVLFVEVTTNVAGQGGDNNFFVRPSRLTEPWGVPTVSGRTASFYLAETGQFSVEFAPSSIWRDLNLANNFDALLLFVNPPLTLPANTELINRNSNLRTLGPNKSYRFAAGVTYDWGQDTVFQVLDNTAIYLEPNSYVRARIVQTTQKVNNVTISGYGVLDNHYAPDEYDVPGKTDDASRQTIHILGKNINVFGLTLVNTNEECGEFGYALNVNANWAPIADYPDDNVFEAGELQNANPPYQFRQAHCQETNMDDSPNTDFTNCPTSRNNDGAKVSFVKAITWQMGQDGINAGKYGTVSDSFIRVVDDAIKPWDSGALYQNIVIWQLPLGWPINLGWWGWTQQDENTVVDGIYLIHNQNWMTSGGWPETQSGQCVVGGVYGSSSVKSGYRIRNIYVETACSCAVGLEINKNAYSRHLTPEGCVGSIQDLQITNMYFDEEFYQTGGYNNFLRGERNPNPGCEGDYAGEISNIVISGVVNGRDLSASDFTVPRPGTVPGLRFQPVDPDPTPGPVSDPTAVPTLRPTDAPTTAVPTVFPTAKPTSAPTVVPTSQPTNAPTVAPTALPTAVPTDTPTASPIVQPTGAPTTMLTPSPTDAPTTIPTPSPTERPSPSPIDSPTTIAPTNSPITAQPTSAPTAGPTPPQTAIPTVSPTTSSPIVKPTSLPTADPTGIPTVAPTALVTPRPTTTPPTTAAPTRVGRVTVSVVIETDEDPQKVIWKIKIGPIVIASGKGNNGSPMPVELDATETDYKFVIIDKNSYKDTFYEVWKGDDVLITGDDFGRKDINFFQVV